MGKVLEYRVARIECERRSCLASAHVDLPDTPEALTPVLARLADAGWSFIIQGRLLAYCPSPVCQDAFRARLEHFTRRKNDSFDPVTDNLNDLIWTRGVEPSRLALMTLPTTNRHNKGFRNE